MDPINKVLGDIAGLSPETAETMADPEAAIKGAFDSCNRARRAAEEECAKLRYQLDDVYAQRNRLAALLALACRAHGDLGVRDGEGSRLRGGLGRDESQPPEWQTTVLMDLPTPAGAGQISFHVHEREVAQFAHIGEYRGAWDGHDDAEKWRRVAACFAGQKRVMEEAGITPGVSG